MNKNNNNTTSQRYWIQEFNAAGVNWIDYVGKDHRTTLDEAVNDLKATRRTFRARRFRLIVRTDAPIA